MMLHRGAALHDFTDGLSHFLIPPFNARSLTPD